MNRKAKATCFLVLMFLTAWGALAQDDPEGTRLPLFQPTMGESAGGPELLASRSPSKPDTSFRTYPNAVGFFSGLLGGTGLSYQRWIGRFGFQISGGVLYAPDDSADILSWFGGYDEAFYWDDPDSAKTYYSYYRTSLFYSAGIEFMLQLTAEDLVKWFAGNIYLFAGANHSGMNRYYYAPVEEYYTDYYGDTDFYWAEDYSTRIDAGFVPSVTVGFGIGVEPLLFRHISMPLEIGYYARLKYFEWDLDNLDANILLQAGLRYRF